MQIIDRYAYGNSIRHVDPALKVGLVGLVIVLCLALNEPQVGLVALIGTAVLAITLAHIPARTFIGVLFAQFAFLLMATLGVLLSFSFSDPADLSDWVVQLGPLWISSSVTAVQQTTRLIFRALGAAAAMNFLALSTPLVDLVELGRRWHVPIILIDLATVIYRFVFVLLGSLTTMRQAQESRLGYQTGYWRAMNNAAVLGSRLFIDAFQRSCRLEIALRARGYENDLHVLPSAYEKDGRLLWASLIIALCMVGIWVAL